MWSGPRGDKDRGVQNSVISAPGNCNQRACPGRETSPFPQAKCFSRVQLSSLRHSAIIPVRCYAFVVEVCFSIFRKIKGGKCCHITEENHGVRRIIFFYNSLFQRTATARPTRGKRSATGWARCGRWQWRSWSLTKALVTPAAPKPPGCFASWWTSLSSLLWRGHSRPG